MTASAFLELTGGTLDPDLVQGVLEEVAEVEKVLEREVQSEVPLVREVGEHTLRSGGKRLRPALVTLAAGAAGEPFDMSRTRQLGACMELIHMATLVHDDVIDRATTRRGRPTASSLFGNAASILSGDALLSKAMAILAEDGDLAIIRNVSRAVVDLAQGEVRELQARGSLDLTEEEHFAILRMKTASLIQSCCQVGGLAAGAPEPIVRALGRYGFHLGLAFQIADDLLDYRGDGARTGKPRAGDFREGCATLPLIYLLPSLDANEHRATTESFGNEATEEAVEMLCRWMRERGAFDRVEAVAERHASEARSALKGLPDSRDRQLLEAVAQMVVARQA